MTSLLVSACAQKMAGETNVSTPDLNGSETYVDTGAAISGSNNKAPDFTLTSQFGRQVSLSQFKGKVVFLTFDDDECTTICPLTTQSLLDMLRLLGPAAQQVQLLGVNANPENTSVQDVAEFSREHGIMNQWLFLTGTKSRLEDVWKEYGIDVEVQNGSIDHTPADFLIDMQGNESRIYLTPPFYSVVSSQAEVWARQTAALLPGHPTVPPLPSALSQTAPLSPEDVTTMPALVSGGKSATIGPQHSYLLAFFASWVPDVSEGLLNLNTYEQAADGRGVANLIAIDVGSVEPTANSGSNLVIGLSSQPSYPLVLDNSGAVADAFDVKDLPWLVLVQNGRIVWSHDGWLGASTLVTQVQAALGK